LLKGFGYLPDCCPCRCRGFHRGSRAVNDIYLKYFKIFGLEKYQMRFSTHAAEGLGTKYANEPES